MTPEETLKEQLQHLKAATIRFNVIHELQGHQLKQWASLIPDVTKSYAKVDVDTKTVFFICQSDEPKPIKELSLYFSNILDWTRYLLWTESNIIIKINKKTVFDSNKL